jgi:hypothetical protein
MTSFSLPSDGFRRDTGRLSSIPIIIITDRRLYFVNAFHKSLFRQVAVECMPNDEIFAFAPLKTLDFLEVGWRGNDKVQQGTTRSGNTRYLFQLFALSEKRLNMNKNWRI